MEIEPDNKASGLAFYELLVQEGNTERAELVLDTLLVYYPGDQDILFSRANKQFENQNWPDLLRTYRDIYIADTDQEQLLMKIYL